MCSGVYCTAEGATVKGELVYCELNYLEIMEIATHSVGMTCIP